MNCWSESSNKGEDGDEGNSLSSTDEEGEVCRLNSLWWSRAKRGEASNLGDEHDDESRSLFVLESTADFRRNTDGWWYCCRWRWSQEWNWVIYILLLRCKVVLKSKRERFERLFNVEDDDEGRVDSISLVVRRSIWDELSNFDIVVWKSVIGLIGGISVGEMNDNLWR